MNESVRTKQHQIWMDEEFVNELKKTNAKRILKNLPDLSFAQISKELVCNQNFHKALDDLVEHAENINISIRIDRKNMRGLWN